VRQFGAFTADLLAVRAVVDSNPVIRGLLRRRPRSVAVRLLDAAIDGRFQLVLSPYLLAEVEQTLREPEVRTLRRLTDPQSEGFIAALAEVAHVVEGRTPLLRRHRWHLAVRSGLARRGAVVIGGFTRPSCGGPPPHHDQHARARRCLRITRL
jgi:hypothetical protein